MLLKGLNDTQLRFLSRTMEGNKDASTFYRALESGSAKIYFTVDEKDLSIRYEASYESTFVGIIVSFIRDVTNAFRPFFRLSNSNLDPLSSALTLYLHDREKDEDEETIKSRYGHFYGLFEKFASLSPSEINSYISQRNQLESLINELDRTVEVSSAMESTSTASAVMELHIDTDQTMNDIYQISFSVRCGNKSKMVHAYELEDIATGRSTLRFAGYNKQQPLTISLSSFSDEDKRILSYLPALKNAASYAYARSAKAIIIKNDFAPLITLLHYFADHDIYFDDVPYHVSSEIVKVKMFIDENGSIAPSIEMDSKDVYLEGDSMSAYFDSKLRVVKLLTFPSRKARILHRFYQSHPDFNYHLFAEEIGGLLLPKISTDTVVDKGFEEKTKIYRTAIKYYLTYNEDQTLTMSTEYSIKGVIVDRDTFMNREFSTYNPFKNELIALHLEEDGIYSKDEDIAPILEADFSVLARLCSLYLSDNLAEKKVKKTIPIKVSAESGIDWFELTFQSDSLTEEEINNVLNAYKKKKKYIRIGNDYYSLDNEELAALAKRFKPEEGVQTQKLPLYQALHLNHDGKSIVSLSKQLIELFHELNDYPSLELELEPHLQAVLRPYQLDGVRWLYSLAVHGLAGILADDMGLGKSLELISFVSLIKEKQPVLIVSPKSLIFNWESEFHKWDPSRQVFVLGANKVERSKTMEHATSIERPILIVSYDTLRNDKEMFEKVDYSAVILDEGQYIANAFAQKSKAVKALKSKYRFVLTGTPIQNSFMDLWSIFDFLMPGYLDDYNEFNTMYRGYESVYSEQGKRLEKMVAPFLLRRKKSDVLQDLPPKTEEVVRIQFAEEEQKLYSGYLANVKKEISKDESNGNKIAILAMLTRLRQLCVDPASFLEYSEISTKLGYVVDMARQAISGGHKILIFSTFAEILLHLQSLLENEGIANHLIYGQTSAAKRLSYAEDFNNNPNVSVMLVSLKAGGTGLNLIGADIVIHLDPWWNIAAEEQATDRAHRIGQTRTVSVYKLIMVGTVEEKVIELQQKKKELTTILHSEGEVGSSLTAEDIYFLLS